VPVTAEISFVIENGIIAMRLRTYDGNPASIWKQSPLRAVKSHKSMAIIFVYLDFLINLMFKGDE
jgi:hypothetical protein